MTSFPLAMDLAEQPKLVANYVLNGLDKVEGWGIDPFLARIFLLFDRFQKMNQVKGNLLEIGVHYGRSAILMALMAARGETAIFVDLFDWQDQNIDFSGSGDRQIFEHNLATWAPDCRVKIIQANSTILDFTSDANLKSGVRFAHIDGAHYREAVLNDIRKTHQVLCEFGIVVIDDFMHSGFPEVNEACNSYLAERDKTALVPVACGMNKLVLTTVSSQESWRRYLAASLLPPIGKKTRFHDYDVYCLDQH
jgi:hypothetical protein